MKRVSLLLKNGEKTEKGDKLTEGSLAVCHGNVHVMLLSVLVYGEALKCKVSTRAIVWLNRPGKVDWGFHAQICHAVLHNFEINSDNTSHLNSTAK